MELNRSQKVGEVTQHFHYLHLETDHFRGLFLNASNENAPVRILMKLYCLLTRSNGPQDDN